MSRAHPSPDSRQPVGRPRKLDRKDAEGVWGQEWSHDIELIGGAIDRLALEKRARILDVGTGFGIMAISLAVAGFDVLTGEPEMEHGKHEWWHEQHSTGGYSDWREAAEFLGVGGKITFQHLDARRLSFEDESFDAVFLYDALQHIEPREGALAECIRVVRRCGVVCAIETNDHGIEYFRRTEGFEIEKVVPSELAAAMELATEVLHGEFSDAYFFKKP